MASPCLRILPCNEGRGVNARHTVPGPVVAAAPVKGARLVQVARHDRALLVLRGGHRAHRATGPALTALLVDFQRVHRVLREAVRAAFVRAGQENAGVGVARGPGRVQLGAPPPQIRLGLGEVGRHALPSRQHLALLPARAGGAPRAAALVGHDGLRIVPGYHAPAAKIVAEKDAVGAPVRLTACGPQRVEPRLGVLGDSVLSLDAHGQTLGARPGVPEIAAANHELDGLARVRGAEPSVFVAVGRVLAGLSVAEVARLLVVRQGARRVLRLRHWIGLLGVPELEDVPQATARRAVERVAALHVEAERVELRSVPGRVEQGKARGLVAALAVLSVALGRALGEVVALAGVRDVGAGGRAKGARPDESRRARDRPHRHGRLGEGSAGRRRRVARAGIPFRADGDERDAARGPALSGWRRVVRFRGAAVGTDSTRVRGNLLAGARASSASAEDLHRRAHVTGRARLHRERADHRGPHVVRGAVARRRPAEQIGPGGTRYGHGELANRDDGEVDAAARLHLGGNARRAERHVRCQLVCVLELDAVLGDGDARKGVRGRDRTRDMTFREQTDALAVVRHDGDAVLHRQLEVLPLVGRPVDDEGLRGAVLDARRRAAAGAVARLAQHSLRRRRSGSKRAPDVSRTTRESEHRERHSAEKGPRHRLARVRRRGGAGERVHDGGHADGVHVEDVRAARDAQGRKVQRVRAAAALARQNRRRP